MFTDHRGQLKTVQFRHANVDQDDGDIVLEQELERFAPRSRRNQILAKLLQDDFIGEQLCGLIVYQKHTGNGSVSFHLISQTGGQNGDGSWVKTAAGFRESTEPGSRDVHISVTSGNSLEPAVRVNPDEQPLHPGENGDTANGTGLEGNGSDTRQPAGRPTRPAERPGWRSTPRSWRRFGPGCPPWRSGPSPR